MEELGFKNAKCNVLLYRYASNKIKRQYRKRYADLLMYCALDKDGKVIDEDKIKDFLFHEHLLEETSEGFFRTTDQGEHVFINEILLPEGKKISTQRFVTYMAITSLIIACWAFLTSFPFGINNN